MAVEGITPKSPEKTDASKKAAAARVNTKKMAKKKMAKKKMAKKKMAKSTTHRTEDPSKAGPRSYVVS